MDKKGHKIHQIVFVHGESRDESSNYSYDEHPRIGTNTKKTRFAVDY